MAAPYTVSHLKELLARLEHEVPNYLDIEIFVQTTGRADSGDHIARVATTTMKNPGLAELEPRLVFEADKEL